MNNGSDNCLRLKPWSPFITPEAQNVCKRQQGFDRSRINESKQVLNKPGSEMFSEIHPVMRQPEACGTVSGQQHIKRDAA